ncbi:MAG: hypothetical protein H5U07_01555 [Candidatus Aminicenantes bacterium]|nr:hypothetical protein [Candidatus Aminicenantes bacterium]
MLYPKTSYKVDNQKHEHQPVGEGLLVGIRDKPQAGLYIYGCPLIGWDI